MMAAASHNRHRRGQANAVANRHIYWAAAACCSTHCCSQHLAISRNQRQPGIAGQTAAAATPAGLYLLRSCFCRRCWCCRRCRGRRHCRPNLPFRQQPLHMQEALCHPHCTHTRGRLVRFLEGKHSCATQWMKRSLYTSSRPSDLHYSIKRGHVAPTAQNFLQAAPCAITSVVQSADRIHTSISSL